MQYKNDILRPLGFVCKLYFNKQNNKWTSFRNILDSAPDCKRTNKCNNLIEYKESLIIKTGNLLQRNYLSNKLLLILRIEGNIIRKASCLKHF